MEDGDAVVQELDAGGIRQMLSFDELFESYAGEVYRFAYALARNSDDAKDITSETFIRAWTRSSAIRTETLKAYLFAIARNLYLEDQRTDRRRVALDESIPDPAPGADTRLESRLELQKLQCVFQTLPETDRAAFVLRVRHELAYEEIARVLGISLAAAKVKVHRVRKKLLTHRFETEV